MFNAEHTPKLSFAVIYREHPGKAACGGERGGAGSARLSPGRSPLALASARFMPTAPSRHHAQALEQARVPCVIHGQRHA